MLLIPEQALLTRITNLVADYNREKFHLGYEPLIVINLKARDLTSLFEAYPEQAFELLSAEDQTEFRELFAALMPEDAAALILIFGQAIKFVDGCVGPIAEVELSACSTLLSRFHEFVAGYEKRACSPELAGVCDRAIKFASRLPKAMVNADQIDYLKRQVVSITVLATLKQNVLNPVLSGFADAFNEGKPFNTAHAYFLPVEDFHTKLMRVLALLTFDRNAIDHRAVQEVMVWNRARFQAMLGGVELPNPEGDEQRFLLHFSQHIAQVFALAWQLTVVDSLAQARAVQVLLLEKVAALQGLVVGSKQLEGLDWPASLNSTLFSNEFSFKSLFEGLQEGLPFDDVEPDLVFLEPLSKEGFITPFPRALDPERAPVELASAALVGSAEQRSSCRPFREVVARVDLRVALEASGSEGSRVLFDNLYRAWCVGGGIGLLSVETLYLSSVFGSLSLINEANIKAFEKLQLDLTQLATILLVNSPGADLPKEDLLQFQRALRLVCRLGLTVSVALFEYAVKQLGLLPQLKGSKRLTHQQQQLQERTRSLRISSSNGSCLHGLHADFKGAVEVKNNVLYGPGLLHWPGVDGTGCSDDYKGLVKKLDIKEFQCVNW